MLSQCPPDTGREIAFAGRSNAGKSSAINTITNVSKLARTSKTPGRTQLINFFGVSAENTQQRIVDLPGYGYAKVPEHVRKKWQEHLNEYLIKRESLSGIVLVVDSRHPLMEFDLQTIEWCIQSQMPLHILLTKADKLKRGPAKSTLLKVKQSFLDHKDLISIQLFSATKKQGIDEAKARIAQLLTL